MGEVTMAPTTASAAADPPMALAIIPASSQAPATTAVTVPRAIDRR
jgi:hypothetical protein